MGEASARLDALIAALREPGAPGASAGQETPVLASAARSLPNNPSPLSFVAFPASSAASRPGSEAGSAGGVGSSSASKEGPGSGGDARSSANTSELLHDSFLHDPDGDRFLSDLIEDAMLSPPAAASPELTVNTYSAQKSVASMSGARKLVNSPSDRVRALQPVPQARLNTSTQSLLSTYSGKRQPESFRSVRQRSAIAMDRFGNYGAFLFAEAEQRRQRRGPILTPEERQRVREEQEREMHCTFEPVISKVARSMHLNGTFDEREQLFLRRRDERRAIAIARKEAEETRELSFRPEISDFARRIKRDRSFLSHLDRELTRRKLQRERLQADKEQQWQESHTFRPEISTLASRLPQRYSVWERLHDRDRKVLRLRRAQRASSAPARSRRAGDPSSDHQSGWRTTRTMSPSPVRLYEDAVRTRERNQRRRQMHDQARQRIRESTKVSEHSERLLRLRALRELTRAADAVGPGIMLDFDAFVRGLRAMTLVRRDGPLSPADALVLRQLWQSLNPTDDGVVERPVVLDFFREVQQRASSARRSTSSAAADTGIDRRRPPPSAPTHVQRDAAIATLLAARVSVRSASVPATSRDKQDARNRSASSEPGTTRSLLATMTDHSRRLSSAHAARHLATNESRGQYLHRRGLEARQAIERQRKLREQAELAECTFKPKINPYHHPAAGASSTRSASASRGETFQRLYRSGRKPPPGPTSLDIEVEQHCTFRPQTCTDPDDRRRARSRSMSPSAIRGYDDTVSRLRRAHQEREEQQLRQQRIERTIDRDLAYHHRLLEQSWTTARNVDDPQLGPRARSAFAAIAAATHGRSTTPSRRPSGQQDTAAVALRPSTAKSSRVRRVTKPVPFQFASSKRARERAARAPSSTAAPAASRRRRAVSMPARAGARSAARAAATPASSRAAAPRQRPPPPTAVRTRRTSASPSPRRGERGRRRRRDAPRRAVARPPAGRSASPDASVPLVNMQVTLGPSRSGVIPIFRDDNPDDLASAFIRTHQLPAGLQDRLAQLIGMHQAKHAGGGRDCDTPNASGAGGGSMAASRDAGDDGDGDDAGNGNGDGIHDVDTPPPLRRATEPSAQRRDDDPEEDIDNASSHSGMSDQDVLDALAEVDRTFSEVVAMNSRMDELVARRQRAVSMSSSSGSQRSRSGSDTTPDSDTTPPPAPDPIQVLREQDSNFGKAKSLPGRDLMSLIAAQAAVMRASRSSPGAPSSSSAASPDLSRILPPVGAAPRVLPRTGSAVDVSAGGISDSELNLTSEGSDVE